MLETHVLSIKKNMYMDLKVPILIFNIVLNS